MELILFFTTLFLLGTAHALEPGHGKLLVTTYLTGNQAEVKDAMLLGGLVAFFHTLSVGLLGTVIVWLAVTFFQEVFVESIEVLSGVVILGLGGLLFWRRFIVKSKHEDQCDCHLLHATSVETETPQRAQTSLKEILFLGLASGMTPCPMALAALVAAFAMGKPLSALGALAVFSLGMGAVLMILGIVLIKGSSAVQTKWQRFRQVPVTIARVSTVLILLLGAYLVSKPFFFPEDEHQQASEKVQFLMPLSIQ